MGNHLIIAGVGLAAGLAGGLLGIGGSVVMIPALTAVLGANQHLYQAAAMIVNFFVAVPSADIHRRAGATTPRTVLRIMPLCILGVIGGVALSELTVFQGDGEVLLRRLFGGFMLSAGLFEMYGMLKRTGAAYEAAPPRAITWGSAAVVAIPTGLVGGLLGVGGGMVAVPLQRGWLRIPIREAIANSASLILVSSLIGACLKNYALVTSGRFSKEPFHLALLLIPTAVIGSYVGSRLVHRLPVRSIKLVFLVVLLLTAVRFMLSK